MYKHDFICLLETYVDSTTPDSVHTIDGCNLVCVEDCNNIKRGRVCIYYKGLLLVRIITLPYFKKSLLLEIAYNKKKVIGSEIYCFSSQVNSEYGLFFV